jgi:hypothetical protein
MMSYIPHKSDTMTNNMVMPRLLVTVRIPSIDSMHVAILPILDMLLHTIQKTLAQDPTISYHNIPCQSISNVIASHAMSEHLTSLCLPPFDMSLFDINTQTIVRIIWYQHLLILQTVIVPVSHYPLHDIASLSVFIPFIHSLLRISWLDGKSMLNIPV